MKKGILIAISATLFLVSCANDKITPEVTTQKNCFREISSETAILIAKGTLFQDYKISDYAVEVIDEQESWKVQLHMKCLECNGGNPYIVIAKKTGAVVKVFHSK